MVHAKISVVRIISTLIFIVLLAASSSCSTFDATASLTPVPVVTQPADQAGLPIETKAQAVVAAQVFLKTTRLDFEQAPKVISVDEMSLEEAQQKVRHLRSGYESFEDRADDTKVWLIMLEGEWRILPPDPEHTFTPGPFLPGCAFIIIDRNERVELATFRCSE